MAIIPCENYNELTVDRCITRAVDALGGVDAFVPPKAQVVLKPNLCLAEPFDKHVTTHPQVVRSIMKLFATKNADIVIGDNPVGDANVTRVEHIFAISGMEKALRGFSYQRSLLQNNLIQLINTIDGQTYPFYVSNDVMQADLLINIPKFKTHTLTLFSGCVKNLFGLLPGNSKRVLHSKLPQREKFCEFLLGVYEKVRPGLHIMDAIVGLEGDGPGTKGIQRKLGLILAGTDGIAVDTVAAMLINLSPESILTNRIGQEIGLGETDPQNIEIVGCGLDEVKIKDFKLPFGATYTSAFTERLFTLARAYLKINLEKCKKCKLCYQNCPSGAIMIQNNKMEINQQKCISCMICNEICPYGAIDSERPQFYHQLKQMRKEK